jgi:hypothetical protein
MAARRINRRLRPQGIIDLSSHSFTRVSVAWANGPPCNTMVPRFLGASGAGQDERPILKSVSEGDSRTLLTRTSRRRYFHPTVFNVIVL